MLLPIIEDLVNPIRIINKGRRIGKDNIGYKVPLLLAFEIIAAIIVEAEDKPILPNIIVKKKQKVIFY